ncbi:MAG: hypothetical protein R2754_01425 [Microthrixaceae bacterium]
MAKRRSSDDPTSRGDRPPTGGPGRGRAALAHLAGAGVAAVVANRALAELPHGVPGGAQRWARTNHRGEPVTLLEGPAAVAGLVAGVLAAAPLRGSLAGASPALVAAAGSGLAGAVDDLSGATDTKGLGGHLRALSTGEVTTGAMKIAAIGAAGLAASALANSNRPPDVRVGAGGVLADGAFVAATANLVNLFDLRPGRALKVAILGALGTTLGCRPSARGADPSVGAEAAAVLGVAVGLMPEDLAEHAMLGDTGANAIGAVLATGALSRWAPRTRMMGLAAVVAATLASERVSFTDVIAGTPGLAQLDQLGRRAAEDNP